MSMNTLSIAGVQNTNTLSDPLEYTGLMYLKEIEMRKHEFSQSRSLFSLQPKTYLQYQIVENLEIKINEKADHGYGSDTDSEVHTAMGISISSIKNKISNF